MPGPGGRIDEMGRLRRRRPSPRTIDFAKAPLGSQWELDADHGKLRAIALWKATDDAEGWTTQAALVIFDERHGPKALPFRWNSWSDAATLGGSFAFTRQIACDELDLWREPVAQALRAYDGPFAEDGSLPTVTLADGRIRDYHVDHLALVHLEGPLFGELRDVGLSVSFERQEVYASGVTDDRSRWVLCTAAGEPIATYAEDEPDLGKIPHGGFFRILISSIRAAGARGRARRRPRPRGPLGRPSGR